MDDIDLEKVQYLLLIHEQRLSTKNQPLTTLSFDHVTSPLHANVASSSSAQNNGDSNFPRGFIQ